ncbi:MAG: serine/threonine-protein kinase, partial [Acidobacteriota bacterium]
MSIPSGTRLGPYTIVSSIGAGGMGEVYKARDTRLQRDVAIKVVPKAIAGDAAALARFEREAQAVAALSHPNILAIHDIGHDAGTAFAVMELLSGKTLREVLSAGPLPIRKALDYGRQIADGLAAAHDRGIIHRDVKPENIFITAEGRAKLLDFGLARVQAEVASAGETMLAQSDTTPGTILGTIGYMAPEQVRGLAVDARTDIFAFGAVLYEMLGGTRAFGGSTPADTLSAILNVDPPDVPALSGSANPGLDRIVRRALEKEPAQRFQSARDLGFALEAIGT